MIFSWYEFKSLSHWMACFYVHRQKELTGRDCGSVKVTLTFRSVNTHWVPLFIYTTKNTAVTSHWHHHFKHCFLVQSIPCKARLTLPDQQGAHSRNGAGSVSDPHRSLLLCNSSYLFWQTLQIPSKQEYDFWNLWATKAPLTLLFHDF